LKIAFLSTFKTMGGISIHTRELFRQFRKRDHEVTVIPEADLHPLVAVEHYLSCLSHGFDVVNVQGTSNMAMIMAGLLASYGMNQGCVCTSHGFSPPRWYSRGLTRKLMRGTLRHYGAVISISGYVEQRLARFFGADSPRLWTIYDGVDEALFNPGVDSANLRQKLGLTGKRVILYSGRMTEKKGVQHLLKAFVLASRKSPELALVYCGRGDLEPELRTMSQEMGLGGKVFFAGPIPHLELPPYYAMCDVLAVPSTYENLGLAPLEAMSTGKPVVASDTGGLPEIVENMKTGLLVPPGDPQALAEALLTITQDEGLAFSLGSAGRKAVLERFTLDRCAEATIGVYRSVLRHAA
jgi:glycosyltransferase involved in cell wall biosynthesis